MQDIRIDQFARLFSEGVESEAPASPAARRRRRAELLRENPGRMFARLCSDLTHTLSPRALRGLPGTLDFILREKGIGVAGLPDARNARRVPDGLAGIASDLSPAAIADAYGRGLFLRWMLGQPAYWAPEKRMTAHPECVTPTAGVEALLTGGAHRVTLDRDFDAVVNETTAQAIRRRAPYAPNSKGMKAFAALHDAGFAHSVEIRNRAGALVGGLYGVACSRIFVVQARFGETPDIADLAVFALAQHLAMWGFDVMDGCADAGLGALGFGEIGRAEHLATLPFSLSGGRPGRWLVVPGLVG